MYIQSDWFAMPVDILRIDVNGLNQIISTYSLENNKSKQPIIPCTLPSEMLVIV